ncbi:MAG: hypothetical protein CMP23_17260 [Rickettsiales bacterium]|nr:hypothetical protein [Rickettsiales bacterium]
MKLQVTFETGHPARLEGIDGVVSPVYSDERPLKGLAGHADWRLNGFISRLLIEDRLVGDRGEWLLVHTQGRLPYTHLFLVGMGPRNAGSPEEVKEALRDVASKVALAGLHAFGINLSEVVGEALPPKEAMVFFLERLSAAYPDDDLSDPPYRPALEAQRRNEERLARARARRQQLVDARAAWEAEEAAQAELAAGSEKDSLSGADGLEQQDEVQLAEELRPRVGQVPPPAHSDAEGGAAEPPHPESVEEPELEDEPERTVQLILLGDSEQLGLMRQALRDWRSEDEGQLEVEWSR